MITVQKKVSFSLTYPLERLGPLDKILFFDIETTGFSGDSTTVYLIGCTYFEGNSWNLIQWFADTLDSEEQLLHEFFQFLTHYRYLVHFNGDGFDIPYLSKRCRHYGLDYCFDGLESIDIYRRIRPYKKLLGLERLKQKAIERYLGVSRTDLCSGGELIEVYENYLHFHDKRMYDLLMLHNEDDLKGMPSILPILSYPDFFTTPLCLDQADRSEGRLLLTLKSPVKLPISFDRSLPLASCHGEGNRLTVSIVLYQGELKYFYSDYKNYYYLIYEDTAIHKSVAEYVDREARVKATAKNCYTRKEGLFLPHFQSQWSPVFKESYQGGHAYVEYDDRRFCGDRDCQTYLEKVIGYLLS